MIPPNRFPKPDNWMYYPSGIITGQNHQGNIIKTFPARVRAYPFPGYTEMVFLHCSRMEHPYEYYKVHCTSTPCARSIADVWSAGPTVPQTQRPLVTVTRNAYQQHFWGQCETCGSDIEMYPAKTSPPIPLDECGPPPTQFDDDELY